MPNENTIEDIFAQIDTHDGDLSQCWLWQGAVGGRARDRGYVSYQGKRWQTHRLVYTLFHGELDESEVVRHICDNPLCCNPSHLEKGTRSDNERDKYRRDRAGLPVTAVREIRRLLDTNAKLSQQQIADYVSKKFGCEVSRETVRNIKLGKRRTDGDEKTMEEVIKEQTDE